MNKRNIQPYMFKMYFSKEISYSTILNSDIKRKKCKTKIIYIHWKIPCIAVSNRGKRSNFSNRTLTEQRANLKKYKIGIYNFNCIFFSIWIVFHPFLNPKYTIWNPFEITFQKIIHVGGFTFLVLLRTHCIWL